MNKFRILCLCPVYGHGKHLVDNAAACFYEQHSLVWAGNTPMTSHIEATLAFIDDREEGNRLTSIDFPSLSSRRVVFYHLKERAPNLPAKYNSVLVDLAYNKQPWHNEIRELPLHEELNLLRYLPERWDAIALWDDDDIYMPWHLVTAASRMGPERSDWYYPNWVGSTYGGNLHLERTGGRFWASCVFGSRLLADVGGFQETNRADFDQQMIAYLLQHKQPLTSDVISYIYRWEDTKASHASMFMSSASDTSWRDRVAAVDLAAENGFHVRPDPDAGTKAILEEFPKPSPMDFLPRWGA